MRSFKQGDIIQLDFTPQAGYERGERQSAIIVSGNDALTLIKSLALVCPITSHSRPFPTHVALDGQTKTSGLILCEQVKALNLNVRNAVFIEKAPHQIIEEVVNILHSLLD